MAKKNIRHEGSNPDRKVGPLWKKKRGSLERGYGPIKWDHRKKEDCQIFGQWEKEKKTDRKKKKRERKRLYQRKKGGARIRAKIPSPVRLESLERKQLGWSTLSQVGPGKGEKRMGGGVKKHTRRAKEKSWGSGDRQKEENLLSRTKVKIFALSGRRYIVRGEVKRGKETIGRIMAYQMDSFSGKKGIPR